MIKWLIKWWNGDYEVNEVSPLDAQAYNEVASLDKLDASGEYKRRIAYANLIDKFPDVPKNLIGMAIEVAVSKLRK